MFDGNLEESLVWMSDSLFLIFNCTCVFMCFLVISPGWLRQDPENQCVLQAFPSEVQEKARYVLFALNGFVIFAFCCVFHSLHFCCSCLQLVRQTTGQG
jgi:hypothetical protein